MKIVTYKQSIGADYHVISDDGTHSDVFYSKVAFKDDEEIEKFCTECQAQRDEAEQAMRDYVPPEQAKIQELQAVIVEKEALVDELVDTIVEKDLYIAQKTEYVADLTKQITDAKLVSVKEKPIGVKELPIEEVIG